MRVEIQADQVINLSKGYMEYMDVKVGDIFEVVEIGGEIGLVPLIECSDEMSAEIDRIIAEHEADPNPHKSYSCVDEMFRDLGIDLGDEDDVSIKTDKGFLEEPCKNEQSRPA
ncbi:MAG: hypothetical protein FWB74_00250 [Defluviitaleaceae bacterium]|nr:hypothetical protein [Defluviitaleaceae bacterium]